MLIILVVIGIVRMDIPGLLMEWMVMECAILRLLISIMPIFLIRMQILSKEHMKLNSNVKMDMS